MKGANAVNHSGDTKGLSRFLRPSQQFFLCFYAIIGTENNTHQARISMLDLCELTILTSDDLRTTSRRLVTVDAAGHCGHSVYLHYLSAVVVFFLSLA